MTTGEESVTEVGVAVVVVVAADDEAGIESANEEGGTGFGSVVGVPGFAPLVGDCGKIIEGRTIVPSVPGRFWPCGMGVPGGTDGPGVIGEPPGGGTGWPGIAPGGSWGLWIFSLCWKASLNGLLSWID